MQKPSEAALQLLTDDSSENYGAAWYPLQIPEALKGKR